VHRETYVYKVVDGCEIKVDVIGATPGASKPGLMWIHGGGLIFGSRTVSPRAGFLRALLDRGFVVVSIDHRLAPETKLPCILEDVRDAWRWIREEGRELFGIDVMRLGIAGGSSGAYLALLCGYSIEPAPRALASFWGFGDITAPWEADPSPFYRELPLVGPDEARRSVGARAISEAPAEPDRSCFYLYCRQQGRWLVETTGHDLQSDADWFTPYCPLFNLSARFPPTILIHGTADTDVPCDESSRLAAALAALRAPHAFLQLDGVGHGFAGATPADAQAAEVAAAAFLQSWLR